MIGAWLEETEEFRGEYENYSDKVYLKLYIMPLIFFFLKEYDLGFYEVLCRIKDLWLEKVVVGGDAKIVVDAIHSLNQYVFIFSDFINVYCLILKNSVSLSVLLSVIPIL